MEDLTKIGIKLLQDVTIQTITTKYNESDDKINQDKLIKHYYIKLNNSLHHAVFDRVFGSYKNWIKIVTQIIKNDKLSLKLCKKQEFVNLLDLFKLSYVDTLLNNKPKGIIFWCDIIKNCESIDLNKSLFQLSVDVIHQRQVEIENSSRSQHQFVIDGNYYKYMYPNTFCRKVKELLYSKINVLQMESNEDEAQPLLNLMVFIYKFIILYLSLSEPEFEKTKIEERILELQSIDLSSLSSFILNMKILPYKTNYVYNSFFKTLRITFTKMQYVFNIIENYSLFCKENDDSFLFNENEYDDYIKKDNWIELNIDDPKFVKVDKLKDIMYHCWNRASDNIDSMCSVNKME